MKTIKKLEHKTRVELVPTAPFHFDSTVFKPGHFPTSDTNWEPGKRWQTMLWRGEKLGLIIRNAGNIDNPRVLLDIYSGKELKQEFVDSIVQEIELRYNFKLDLQNFYEAFRDDSQLSPILQKFRGLRPMNPGSLYEYLIVAIVLQNATVRRSVNMMQALFEKYGSRIQFDQKTFFCFWMPQTMAKVPEDELRALKVGYRAKTFLRVSHPFAEKEMDELELRSRSQLEQEEALMELYGIGPASVGYIMFDVFHHWDFLKHISPWEQKIYTKLFFNKDYHRTVVPVEKMIRHFEKRFGRYKALAVHYIWEDLWWKRRNEKVAWLEELIRL